MPDIHRERYFLETLRAALPEIPSGEPERGEPPDFLLQSVSDVLGIELTVFHLPSAPGTQPYQERQSLKDRIVNIAERKHHEAGGPALYVSVFFNAHCAIRKQGTASMAEALASSILRSPKPRSFREPVELPWGRRPEFTSGILIHPSVDGQDKLWHPDAGGWIAEVTSEHLQDVLKAKARRASVARTRCDRLWLAIVNDAFGRAAPAEITSETLSSMYETAFDRVLWLIPSHPPKAIDLNVKPAV